MTDAINRNLAAALVRRAREWTRFVAVALFTVTALAPAAQEPVYDANQVKAAFLYHFGTYVQWPADAPSTDAITIAVLDDAAVIAQLAAFLPGRSIDNRSVQVRALARIEDLADEELLFIGRASNARLMQVIEAVGQRPVLIVTDAEDGLDRGAMVNFQLVDSRVRFEISVPRAEEAGLTLSSRLLSAALRVETSNCCRPLDLNGGLASVPRFGAGVTVSVEPNPREVPRSSAPGSGSTAVLRVRFNRNRNTGTSSTSSALRYGQPADAGQRGQ